jgi:uncharacterized protein (TIGR03089 family)
MPAPRLVSVIALLTRGEVPARIDPPYPGVAAALAARLRADPTSPMVTFYDDDTGERTELSVATLDNWVAKTANLLVDTLGLTPGDRVAVDLPVHWLTVVVLLAAWSAGLDVAITVDPEVPVPEVAGVPVVGGVNVAFVAEDRVDAALALDADETVALSLLPFGRRFDHPIAGVLDYAAEVPAHGDRFVAPAPPAEQADLLRLAAHVAAGSALAATDRVLSTTALDAADGLLGALLAPLVAGASVVLCRHWNPAALGRRLTAERVTAVCGATPDDLPDGVRRLTLPSP